VLYLPAEEDTCVVLAGQRRRIHVLYLPAEEDTCVVLAGQRRRIHVLYLLASKYKWCSNDHIYSKYIRFLYMWRISKKK
jgi:hypothetical protein